MEENNWLCRILWVTDNIASSSDTAASAVLQSDIFKYAFDHFWRSQDLDDSFEYDEESKDRNKYIYSYRKD